MHANRTEIIARAVIRRDGRILLVRQVGKKWSFLPGGHVEPGEPTELALTRELAEELGAKSTINSFLGAVEHGYVEDGTTHHEINLVFDVALDTPDPVSHKHHLEFHWLALDHLAEADVRPNSLKDALLEAKTFWRGWAG